MQRWTETRYFDSVKFSFGLTVAFISTVAHGQNLVPNPSFEITDSAYCSVNDFRVASQWFGLITPDYFHTNNDSATCGLPAPGDASWGWYQFPRTGNAHGGFGFGTLDSCANREYPEVKLNSPLIAGKVYCVEFYVSLMGKSDEINFGCDCIQAVFTTDTLFLNYPPCANIIQYAPIKNPYGNILKDTLNWVKVSGNYYATGGENFLTIGCFSPIDSITPNYPTGNYYFLDDVSVTDCGWGGIDEETFSTTVTIFPNPFSSSTTLQTDNLLHNATLTVDNCFGQTVAQIKNISGQTITFNRDNLASGLYFVRLTTSSPSLLLKEKGEGVEVIATGKLVITD